MTDQMIDLRRRNEAVALDERLHQCFTSWQRAQATSEAELFSLARDIFIHQASWNIPYQRFLRARGCNAARISTWEQIPAVPASAFKDAELVTFDPATAAVCFQTSGTTQARRGRHWMETTALYDAAAFAIFEHFILQPAQIAPEQAFVINLAFGREERPESSLAYMIDLFMQKCGNRKAHTVVQQETIDVAALEHYVRQAQKKQWPCIVIGTALAYAHLVESLNGQTLRLPPGSLIIETGGFKGVATAIDRANLYVHLGTTFSITEEQIVAEFGMTELTSQYYDSPASRNQPVRVKIGPPWLRSLVIDAQGEIAAPGTVGILRHIDLANRASVIAIDTEDLAIAQDDGFVLLGRDHQAELRGCSLDAETLRALVN